MNEQFNIILGINLNKRFTYNIYTHFLEEYKVHRNIAHFSGYPLVMNSSNLNQYLISEFKELIKTLNDNESSVDIIISKQKEFHKNVSKIDPTVNDELFHEYYIKS